MKFRSTILAAICVLTAAHSAYAQIQFRADKLQPISDPATTDVVAIVQGAVARKCTLENFLLIVNSLTAKSTPTGSDKVPIYDAAAAAVKSCTLTQVLTAGINATFGGVGATAITGADSSLGITGLAGSAGSAGGAIPITGGAGHTNGAGGAVGCTGGVGAGTGNGGSTSLIGGNSGSGATGDGGSVAITAGRSAATNGNGGAIGVTGGIARGTGTGGTVAIAGGESAGASGTAGAVTIDAGSAAGGTGAAVTIGATNATGVTLGRSGQDVTIVGNTKSTVGAGTVVTNKATAVEYGNGVLHKTVLTLTLTGDHDLDLADGDHGTGVKVYGLPEGRILVLGVTCDLSVAHNGAFNASAADTFSLALGTVVGADDAALTSTEADLIPTQTLDTDSGGTTPLAADAALAASAHFDGTTTAKDVYVNVACANANNSGATTYAVTGTVTLTWVNLGDY